MNEIFSLFSRKSKQVVPIDSIVYNVDNFNLWIYEYQTNLYLKPDKLFKSNIEDYLLKSYGISNFEPEKVNYLFIKVKNDWKNKVKNNN